VAEFQTAIAKSSTTGSCGGEATDPLTP